MYKRQPEKVAQSIKKNLGMEKENGSYGMPADQNPEWNKNDDDMFVKAKRLQKKRKVDGVQRQSYWWFLHHHSG